MKKKRITFLITLTVFLGVLSPCFSKGIPNKSVSSGSIDNNIPKEVTVWLNKELANSSTQVLESFDGPEFYTSKNAKIIGYIKGYDQSQGAKTVMFYHSNELTREKKPKVLEIHEDGRFELELPLDYPMHNYLKIKDKHVGFYVEPGQTLSVILDNENLNNKKKLIEVVYQGNLKSINENIHHFGLKDPIWKIYNSINNTPPMKFKKMVLEIKDELLQKLEAHRLSEGIDKKSFELLENEVSLGMYYHLFEYFIYNKKKYVVPEGYYDFIKNLPLNKQSILVSSQFGGMINGLEYSAPLKVKTSNKRYSYDASILRFLKFLENRNVEVLKNEKEKLINENKVSDAFQKKHKTHYDDFIEVVDAEVKILREQSIKDVEIEKWKRKDSLASVLGIRNDITYDIIKLRSFKSWLNNNSEKENFELNKWLWRYTKQGIESPYLIKLGDKLLEESYDFNNFYELPKSDKGTNVLKKIIGPYQGKVVIFRFWQPYGNYKKEKLTCFKQLREQYRENEDVEFIDVSVKGLVSEKLYADFVKDAGYKNAIRVSQDEYNYLIQLFQIEYSSQRFVIDKKGNVLKDWYPRTKLVSYLKSKFKIKPLNEFKEEELIGCFK